VRKRGRILETEGGVEGKKMRDIAREREIERTRVRERERAKDRRIEEERKRERVVCVRRDSQRQNEVGHARMGEAEIEREREKRSRATV